MLYLQEIEDNRKCTHLKLGHPSNAVPKSVIQNRTDLKVLNLIV